MEEGTNTPLDLDPNEVIEADDETLPYAEEDWQDPEQQNRSGTGEDETIEREEDVRRHVGGMPLLTDLSLAMRTDPLALIRGATEFVTVIYGPAVTFAFPDVKVEAYRRSVLHLNLISAVNGNALNSVVR